MQIDFYVLNSSDEQSRLRTVCRVADKVQRLGHDIFVLTCDSKQSKQLDDLMWTFSQSSFLPHAILDESNEYKDQQPVLIHHEIKVKSSQVVINLQKQALKTDQFNRVVEIVNQDQKVREQGRTKYRYYKDQQLDIKTHNLSS